MESLWETESPSAWEAALGQYESVVARQGGAKLVGLDTWYRSALPDVVATRDPRHVTLAELVRVTEWKMSRGVWRARNLVLVRSNSEDGVVEASRAAFAAVPDLKIPLACLTELAGVGPATASAVLAAGAPQIFPFFDDLVAEQIPELGKVAYTISYYKRYAAALRERAKRLGRTWDVTQVERALWAWSGGKAGPRTERSDLALRSD